MERRSAALERLGSGVFDLLVIGGGIIGSRVAYDAARLGLRVALVDAGDFAGATSGASAGLVHGGLRYLRRGAFGLVRDACRERHALASRVAPHLVKPQPILAACAGGALRRAQLAAGLSIYAAIGGPGWPCPRPASHLDTATLAPHLRPGSAAPLAFFHEAEVDDARLTLATVKAAARSGAVVVNHAGVADMRVVLGGVSEAVLDSGIRVRARAIVNATGPWMDVVRRMEDPACAPLARLSKGVHVALRVEDGPGAGLAVFLEDGGHFYAVPKNGVLLVGTTDDAHHGDPAEAVATPADACRLLCRAATFLPAAARAGGMLSAFAGLRVLPRGNVPTPEAARDHLLSVGPGGMVSVAGGKLTTHRRIALSAIRNLPANVRPRNLRVDATPLPGASTGKKRPAPPLPGATGRHLVCVYGAEAGAVLARYAGTPGALEPVSPGGPDVWAQVHYAAGEEWAITVDDVVRRRTTLALRGQDTLSVRARISAVLQRSGCSPLSSGKTA